MTDTDRAERAADLADRRARDSEQAIRWIIGIGIGLLIAIGVQMLYREARITELRLDVDRLETEMIRTRIEAGLTIIRSVTGDPPVPPEDQNR